MKRFISALVLTAIVSGLPGCDIIDNLKEHLPGSTQARQTEPAVCTQAPTEAPTIASTEAPTQAPTQAPVPAPTEPVITIPYPALGAHTDGAVWDESVHQIGQAITPEPGDTQDTFDYARIENHGEDDLCTDSELLDKWLDVEGLTLADLDARGCRQLILAAATEGDGVITSYTCYQRQEDGSWVSVEGLRRMNGWAGGNGVVHGRLRNTKTSPAGLWSLGLAFGISPKPEGIRMPWRDVTPYSDWVDDENSPYFNTWQERNDPNVAGLWNEYKAEHLEEYDFYYDYCCVIRYNAPPYTIPERGSAIFLHCSDQPTAGCLGLPKADMLRILYWLDPAENPYILITGHPKP